MLSSPFPPAFIDQEQQTLLSHLRTMTDVDVNQTYLSTYEIKRVELKPSQAKSIVQWNPFKRYGSDGEHRVWTFAARGFLLSITGFVFVTVSMLAAAMRLQTFAAEHEGYGSIQGSLFYTAYLLQAQSIVCELVLLIAAYFAIVTQNLVAVVAALMFNIYLVIAGFIEAGQRNILLENNESNGPEFATLRKMLWAIPVIDMLFHVGSDWFACKLYKELGWSAYKVSSADVAIGTHLQHVHILLANCFFASVFAFIEFTSTLILGLGWLPLFYTQPSKVPALIPGGLRFLLPGIFALLAFLSALLLLKIGVRQENRKLAWAAIALQIASLALHLTGVGILAPLLREASERSAETSGLSTDGKVFFQFAVTIALLVSKLAITVLVLRGFGKGLKERETQLANSQAATELNLSN